MAAGEIFDIFLFSWHFLTKSFEFSDKIISILGIYLGFIWIYFLSVTNFDCCTYSVRSLFALGKNTLSVTGIWTGVAQVQIT